MIRNGKDTTLNANSGTVPDMSGALRGWFQDMVLRVVTKSTVNFNLVETATTVNTRGVIQPFSAQQLMMKPEGMRSWKWSMVHVESNLNLANDDVIVYLGTQYRVMGKQDYSLYGYFEYHVIEDFTGSGPA